MGFTDTRHILPRAIRVILGIKLSTMKRILVPVDFSDYSEYALQVAAEIAHLENAEIVVVHMLGLSDAVFTKSETEEVFDVLHYMELTHKKFESFLKKEYLEGIEVHVTVRNYRKFHELNEVAAEWQADLIVMGSHGLSGIGDVFVGSNTEKVIRSSEVPVLVVKREKDFQIRQAVFVTDFNEESVQPYKDIRRFLKLFGCEPRLLHVNLPEKFSSTSEILAKSSRFIQNAEVDNPEIFDMVDLISDYTLESGIFNYTAERDVDLLIVPTHGRKGLAHFFYGSAGESIANHSTVPVMTMKIPN